MNNIFLEFAIKLLEAYKEKQYKYVIHKHAAYKAGLHYDLRIEKDNKKLDSWAVRKGPPEKPGEKRLAVKQPVHKSWWLTFKGEIPKGEYGGGKFEIWDTGTLKKLVDRENDMVFEIISSKKLEGKYILHRMSGQNWIFFKAKK